MRKDFFRKEEEEVLRGRSDARAKSEDSEGSLGWVMVDGVVDVGVPRNWEFKSLYWRRSVCSVSWRVRDALRMACQRKKGTAGGNSFSYAYEVSPASCNRARS